MPPPSDSPALHIHVSHKTFFLIQLAAGSAIPSDLLEALCSNENRFISVTKTAEELSIVGERYNGMPEEYEKQCDWTCIKIRGPMEHSLVGVLAAFSEPLKAAGVPIFALSTWNTDYILVPSDKKDLATKTLQEDGWTLSEDTF